MVKLSKQCDCKHLFVMLLVFHYVLCRNYVSYSFTRTEKKCWNYCLWIFTQIIQATGHFIAIEKLHKVNISTLKSILATFLKTSIFINTYLSCGIAYKDQNMWKKNLLFPFTVGHNINFSITKVFHVRMPSVQDWPFAFL